MKPRATTHKKLRQLVETGTIPESRCSGQFLGLLGPLIDSGVVRWERFGVGRRLVVLDPSTLKDFSRQRFPEAHLPSNAGSRVTSVGRFRDTKVMKNSEGEIVSLRVWRNEALLKEGKSVNASALTDRHGVFSLLFTKNCPYTLSGAFALTENPAVFATVERLGLGVDAVIYGHGRISNRVMDWLVRAADAKFTLLHMPDYDPVGLSEFQRLYARFGARVALHLPDEIESQFARFSNPELLAKARSQTMLAQLRHSELAAVRRVVALIDRHNAGLEQEALLIQA